MIKIGLHLKRFGSHVTCHASRVTFFTISPFRYFTIFLCFLTSVLFGQANISLTAPESAAGLTNSPWVLIIHGGAGGPAKGTMPEQTEQEYLKQLSEVLRGGAKILENGGSSLDAVEFCIRLMEDSPLFNAGKGAVFNEEGKIELDASIMDGKTLKAGAVAGVTTIKNPISAARAVMANSQHVMLAGAGAETFAKNQGLEIVDPSYFFTKVKWELYENIKQQREKKKATQEEKHGTVGAVALDQNGNLAAGTSTGGMSNKMKGRIGDSPIIGAGTYANNSTCAVSATGHGEFFIRNVLAYDVSAMMEYKGISLEEAGKIVIMEKLKMQQADGGLIAIDKNGNFTMPFNTNAMFRGYIKSDGNKEVLIY
jgi:L-asparaginase / beta-aspartyl-peptidase